MAQPDMASFKTRLAAVDSCDITPDDVELLPWNFNKTKVNTIKAMKIMNDYTQALEARGEPVP